MEIIIWDESGNLNEYQKEELKRLYKEVLEENSDKIHA